MKRVKKKPGPRSTEERFGDVTAPTVAWVRESEVTLVELNEYIRKHLREGTLDPVLAIGAFRALAQVVNDRDAIIKPLENGVHVEGSK